MSRPGYDMEAHERRHAFGIMASHIEIGWKTKPIFEAGQKVGAALEADRRRRWWQSFEPNRDHLLSGHRAVERAENALREWVMGKLEEAYDLGLGRGMATAQPERDSYETTSERGTKPEEA